MQFSRQHASLFAWLYQYKLRYTVACRMPVLYCTVLYCTVLSDCTVLPELWGHKEWGKRGRKRGASSPYFITGQDPPIHRTTHEQTHEHTHEHEPLSNRICQAVRPRFSLFLLRTSIKSWCAVLWFIYHCEKEA